MKRLPTATLLACSALVLAACGGGGTADVLNISNPTMRIVNAMPSDPALQLYRNSDQQTIAGMPTYEESSKYFDTVNATSEWSVRDASTGLQIGDTSLAASGSTRYTLIAFPGSTTAADLMQISDPYDVSLTSDSARVRVVNASLNSGPFDVYITAPGVDIVANAATLTNVAYETAVPASGENSYSFPSGTYEIRLTIAGTKTVFFDGTLSANNNDDLLLVSLPNSDAAGDVKLLDIPSATDELNSEIFSD
jgi:hypothetical protein